MIDVVVFAVALFGGSFTAVWFFCNSRVDNIKCDCGCSVVRGFIAIHHSDFEHVRRLLSENCVTCRMLRAATKRPMEALDVSV